MIAWRENDELFFAELAAGRKWEFHVAGLLLRAGLWVQMPLKSIRAKVEDSPEYADEADLWVGRYSPAKIEVKSRRLEFTSKEDYPAFALPAFVTTLNSWQHSTTKPVAFIVISQETGAAVAISAKTHEKWTMKRTYDRMRGIEETFLCAPKVCLYDFHEFVQGIQRRERVARG